ncbi:hypothetical protein [Chelativorans alearense]|uniref:hypothetical protein n=1 Tax=Chelativorans alearense TaxID=2681495 RepID=UPI003CCD9996
MEKPQARPEEDHAGEDELEIPTRLQADLIDDKRFNRGDQIGAHLQRDHRHTQDRGKHE